MKKQEALAFEKEVLKTLKEIKPIFTVKNEFKKIKKEHNLLEEVDSEEENRFHQELNLHKGKSKKKSKSKKKKKTKSKSKKKKKKEKSFFSKFKPFNKWFRTSITYSSTLNNMNESNYGREALKATITVSPYPYFSMGTTVSLDTNNYENIYYQPDFSYSFGYSDWHQGTWGWNYSNYANNKFNPKEKESRFHFQEGTWEIGYKDKIEDISLSAKVKYTPSRDDKKIVLKAKTTIMEKVMVSAQLRHTLETKQNQITLSAKTVIYDKFFVSTSAYLYPEPKLQGSLDPDFAYSFGWKDSRPFYPSITYSNYYTATRWGWKDKKGPHFKDGTISINFNIKF